MSSNVTHAKEPLFRMVKRDAIPQKKAWMIRAAAFLLSLATGAVVIMMLGHNPFSVYISMIKGAWGTKTVSYETIKIAIPLLITAIGISFAFKMKFWNIGGEGQVLIGGLAAAACMICLGDKLPNAVVILCMIVASLAAGAIWGFIPAWFKAKWNTNETLFTLMMNYIAIQITAYFVALWENPIGSNTVGVINSKTKIGWFPEIFGQVYTLNVILVLTLAVGMYIYPVSYTHLTLPTIYSV